jgi:hypothetical protein
MRFPIGKTFPRAIRLLFKSAQTQAQGPVPGSEPPGETNAMAEYRIYVIGSHGHFIQVINLDCADDKAAIESAKQFVGDHALELWQGDRHIAKFDPKPK